MPTSKTSPKRRADQYNDPSHNYLHYWDRRKYEHQAEEIAIKKLLRGQHFAAAVDVGGGYGRLSILLKRYADQVVLAEPSQQQLDLANDFLKGQDGIKKALMSADDLKFKDGSVDLVTLIRVMHHLPDPTPELREIARVLSPSGYAIIEVANYSHIRNRLKHFVKRRPLPLTPVDIRSESHKKADEIPFVNHNPNTVIRQLNRAGLKVEKVLSVSNLRSPSLKKVVPRFLMLGAERLLQKPLAKSYFGPSIFFLVRKKRL